MFFFFVGGVEQQVRQVLKSGAGRCISCRSPADLVDYDKVLKLFFVPVWRWPGKQPLMHCNNCNLFFPQSYSLPPPPNADSLPPPSSAEGSLSPRCRFCDRIVKPDFRFCPFCGAAL
ncbi:Zinc-ribbon [Trema orientale]|uniref:Zinc-ribbon n=1 Tax=Trema orientale TaxID=63057 RepID=A0A2P5EHP0_TREOI|nr:Zinc-ribbon [Trema orientale]